MKGQRMRDHFLPAALLLFLLGCGGSASDQHNTGQSDEECVRNGDRWDYRGVPIPFENYRDHHIIFNGEHVPVSAGTMIWISVNPYYTDDSGRRLTVTRNMRLEGGDAELFEVTYHSAYEYTAPGWSGSRGELSPCPHCLAIWRKPREGEYEQWQSVTAGHVMTTAEDLEEGEYSFDLRIEYASAVSTYCERREFKVIVDRDSATTPPAPANVRVQSKDSEGWTIGWDPTHGVDRYWVKVYRLDGDDEDRGAFPGSPNGLSYRIRFADMEGCGDVVYIKIYPEGDGRTYLRVFGEPSKPIEMRAEPCQP